ncbi:MAG: ABC transporter permease subunit, partial [Thermoanaerobaculia bacterium]|nr:ABC transporter permease subunit [Thermoanaerobaculia bacterium]
MNRGWQSAGVLVASSVAVPIVVVLASVGADSEGVWAHLAATVLPSYVVNTLLLAAGVAVGTFAIGTGTAWIVTMCRFPGQRVLWWALLLPLAIPVYLSAYAYSDLLQFSGPVQSSLREALGWTRGDYWFPAVRSLGGAVVIFSFGLYPYVYLAARTAFLEQSVCALEVSRTLGHGGWSSFRRVALPLARPSIVAGLMLALMETLA